MNHGSVTFGGADAAMMRKTGAYVIVGANGSWQVMGVLPDTPAARLGIRPNDYINVAAVGESPPEADQIARAILGVGELRVAREIDGVLVDLVLPEATYTAERAEGL